MNTKTTYVLNWTARLPDDPKEYSFTGPDLPTKAAALEMAEHLREDMKSNPSCYGGKYMVAYSVTEVTETEIVPEVRI